MCLVLTPLVPFIPFLTGGLLSPPGPVSPPQQGAQQNQPTVENPNDIQSFEDFMSQFGRTYSSSAEQAYRQDVFLLNLAIINVSFKPYLLFLTFHFWVMVRVQWYIYL